MKEELAVARVAEARAELAAALDAIEEKLNVKRKARRLSRRIRASIETNPTPWIAAGAVVVLGVAGAVVWVIVKHD